MKKGIATITSEIMLTIIVLSLAIPLFAYIGSLGEKYIAKNIFLTPLTCIVYKYIDTNKIILYNDCNYNIKVYSFNKVRSGYSILYYNDTVKTFMETSVIYAKGLHLLIANNSSPKVVLNTSHGLLILSRK